MQKKNKIIVITLFIILLIYFLSLTCYISYYGRIAYKDFYLNLLVEATSIIVEFGVLGFVLSYFLDKNDEKVQIMRLKNEIDYIRFLRTDETKFKIFGIIKQLNDLKENSIHLQNCNLSFLTELSKVNLTNSKLHVTDFSHSIMKTAILNNTEGERTNFQHTKLSGSIIQESKFIRCNFNNSLSKSVSFKGTHFSNTTFINANLFSSKFLKCTFNNCDFSNSMLERVDFKGSTFNQVNFNEADVSGANFNDCNNFSVNLISTAKNNNLIQLIV
ncbi:MAG: pentapeptide repeat-containing protein [Bacteroidota bacterium]